MTATMSPVERKTSSGITAVAKRMEPVKRGRPAKKGPTVPVRMRASTAEAVERLAGVYGETTPDFLSRILKPILTELARKAPEKAKEILPLIEND